MKLRVLVDNHTYIDEYYLGEPGLSYYIEDNDARILFDTGYSDVFIHNGKKMGIDFATVNTVVFSHGHNDHTRGFQFLDKESMENLHIYAHEDCFNHKVDGEEDIGAPFRRQEISRLGHLHFCCGPTKISEHITFLGEIPQINDFELRKVIGQQRKNRHWEDDLVLDDSALVFHNNEGLFIITSCSHGGICNIIEYAKRVCHEDRILGIIGGFHLFEVDEQVNKTVEYFKDNQVKDIYPCHCVSFQVKAKINESIKINEVGVGLTIDI